MKSNTKYIQIKQALYIRLLYQEQKLSVPEIMKRYPQYSRATIYWHVKRPVAETIVDRGKQNKGRPCKLSAQNKRLITTRVE